MPANTLFDSSLGDITRFSGVGGLPEVVNPSINIVATTNTFALAVSITAGMNVVVSGAVANSSPVVLPTAANWMGGTIGIFNQSTATVAVWMQPNDVCDGKAAGTTVLVDAGKRSLFIAVSTTGIISAQMGTTSV